MGKGFLNIFFGVVIEGFKWIFKFENLLGGFLVGEDSCGVRIG